MRTLIILTFSTFFAAPLTAQTRASPTSDPDLASTSEVSEISALRPDAPPPPSRSDSEFLLPLISAAAPGTGQFVHHAPLAGLGYAGIASGGYLLADIGEDTDEPGNDLPRTVSNQIAHQARHTIITAGFLSAWDAFHRAVPARQARGEYLFLDEQETVGDLLSAPVDTGFLDDWTTWVDFAMSAGVLAFAIDADDATPPYYGFGFNDAAFAASLSLHAAVGEEAFFRGWMLPLLHQNLGGRFWLANSIQAFIFGAAHVSKAGPFTAYIAAWAAWEGWLTRSNGWSVRESIFHHFWYDAAVTTAALLTQERDAELRITFPTIRF